ncbi:hypothetical protein SS50377_25867 [Spironucleus salmonicida]|uniref:Uncharacterized protein n=1 Tax=Spironucleus salmonicida TaxID=348837 RepID=V6LXS6_9EUKA|nr:hypothetical protein SS50377_25867 [Spironucleus salmonicida]|eukprot:EST49053.1 Hypothetical protein SS50377_10693 [Spironucleus salmonicida]
MLNSTNLQLLNQTQRELLEELDQENRQLKQQLKQQGQLMHQVQNVLTRYGATQGLSLTDQIEILMTQHQQRKIQLKQKAVKAITELAEHDKFAMLAIQRKSDAEMKVLRQTVFEAESRVTSAQTVKKYKELSQAGALSEVERQVAQQIQMAKMDNRQLVQLGSEKLDIQNQALDLKIRDQKDGLGRIYKEDVVMKFLEEDISEEDMARKLILNGDVF